MCITITMTRQKKYIEKMKREHNYKLYSIFASEPIVEKIRAYLIQLKEEEKLKQSKQ